MKTSAASKKQEISVENPVENLNSGKKDSKVTHIQKVIPQKGTATVSDPGCRPLGR